MLVNKNALAVAGCLGSGLLLALAQPGFEFWPLAWVALLPLFRALRGAEPGRAFKLGWLAGSAYYATILYWIAPTIANYTQIELPLAIVLELLLAAAAGLFIGGFAASVEWLAAAGISRVLSAPALWIVLEWARTFFPAAFPWGFVGYSQYAVGPIIQAADVAGVYGISALLIFTNAVLAELLRDGWRRHRALATALVGVCAVTIGYGALRSQQMRSLDGPRLKVGLVQANIAQNQKWHPALAEKILARHVVLTANAVSRGAELVVWPEAAVPFFLNLDEKTEKLRALASQAKIDLLVGAPGYERRGEGPARQYNQAWLLTRNGALVGPYDKIRLVPFGEYVPWGGLLGWVHKAVEGVGDFGAGSDYVVFDIGPRDDGARVRASALICYEAIFPDLTRRFVAAGARLLVNVSNDAWYGRTVAPHQLLAMVAVRAVENRVPVVRATNTGISAFVDVDGKIREATGLFEEAAVVAELRLVSAFSPYALLGDWLVFASIALLILLALVRLRSGSLLIRDNRRGILTR